MPNRLQYESSPYLLQHANNPVDWYPWGEEAFERAQREQKPVLVSIGYAACHWCHVMEHESFEDASIAAYMNEHFVSIKVDREEHPDVDHLYMDALQAMTGSGGWPLNMFVTPERQPFYGGTYFPPKALYGRSSWLEILQAIYKAWHEKPEEIALQAGQMVQHLQQASLVSSPAGDSNLITAESIHLIAENILKQGDADEGGFGAAPKFPATGAIQFLLEYFHFNRTAQSGNPNAATALQHALLSLDKMIGGGIYDQVGGGFARYATDREWLVPHFEKMLYDNALLLQVLSDAYTLTKDNRYLEVIEATVAFCNRELRPGPGSTDLGFYCALDADSEGVEGKFYTWTWLEWQDLMQDAHPALAVYYGVSETGNWEHTNILNRAMDTASVLQQFGLDLETWQGMLLEANAKLLAKRGERIRPQTDDKILLSWNALMNTALVKAALASGNTSLLEQAGIHMDWLLQTFGKEGLKHVYKNGVARIGAKLEDYAYLIQALLQLASAAARPDYITRAEALLLEVEALFLHEDRNFFYFSAATQTDIIVRKVELYDGATPSANAVMAENLWHLGNLCEKSEWLEQSEAMLHHMLQTVQRYPTSFARWATFLQRYSKGLQQLIISGKDASEQLGVWQQHFHPEILAMADVSGLDTGAFKGKYVAGQTWCYLCAHFICRQPVARINELELG